MHASPVLDRFVDSSKNHAAYRAFAERCQTESRELISHLELCLLLTKKIGDTTAAI